MTHAATWRQKPAADIFSLAIWVIIILLELSISFWVFTLKYFCFAVILQNNHRYIKNIDCSSFVLCVLLAPHLPRAFFFFLLQPLTTVPTRQTRQAVRAINQSIFLRCRCVWCLADCSSAKIFCGKFDFFFFFILKYSGKRTTHIPCIVVLRRRPTSVGAGTVNFFTTVIDSQLK